MTSEQPALTPQSAFDFAQSSLLQTDPEAVKGHGAPFDSAQGQ